jgi:hypothetical protein
MTYDGDSLTPAVELLDDSSATLPDRLAPGDSAESVTYFAVPLETKQDIRIIVDIAASQPDVVFVGPRPR